MTSKQEVREFAHFDKNGATVTRKYVPLEDFERLRAALEILAKARWRGDQQATMREVNRIASEALRGADETTSAK